jgi:imidazoleglycerol-phosphate dehydratase
MPKDGNNERIATISRKTVETEISVSVNLDGTGKYDISTGIGFFDHMLEQLSKHSLIDITIKAKGDLHIDGHHTAEDVGITLGQAIKEAVGDKKGIRRYGHFDLVMDEARASVSLDLSNRPFLVWDVNFSVPKLGEMDTELFQEFFNALAGAAGMTYHVKQLAGTNNHHIIEAVFKASAKALRMALEIDVRASDQLPSTKGRL